MLKEFLDKGTLRFNKEKQRKRENIHISDAGQCKRKIFFEFNNDKYPPEEFDVELLRMFNVGSDAHIRICGYLKVAGVLKDEEIVIPKNEFGISGRADGIVNINGEDILIEIKTINTYDMKEPLEEHKQQISLYMYFLKRKYPNLKRGILVYESKGTQAIFEFPIEPDEEYVKTLLEEFRKLDVLIKAGKVPDISSSYINLKFPCLRCRFKKYCWNEKGERLS
jgi:CRISPR/Cas system-associated exonuclease Cas4 (RecB family)